MKKKIVALVAAALLVVSFVALAVAGEQKWSCSRYYNGNYEGYMTVWASSHSEAMAKAVEFYKSYTYTSIKCVSDKDPSSLGPEGLGKMVR